jgi:choline dehydrogenase-like flavoprotein
MLTERPAEIEATLTYRSFDICIIGAGAAGIALATELDGSPVSVALLEAGGLDVTAPSQNLYSGEQDAPQLPANYLTGHRLRVFGGTTGHWAGEGRPLDEIDFERRDWIPHSGWPIDRRQLDAYYRRASRYCSLPAIQPDDAAPLPFSFRPLYSARRVPRFGSDHRDALRASANVHVFLSCPAVRISNSANGREVATVTVAAGNATQTIHARTFVLAAGTVENARLLLHSARLGALRLGREEAAVGRYFMDHGEGTCALLRLPGDELEGLDHLLATVDPRLDVPYVPTLWLSPRVQALRHLPNAAFQLSALAPEEADELEELGRVSDFLRGAASPKSAAFEVSVRGETRPNPENRVSLTESVDDLGLPKVKLAYRWNPEDLAGFQQALELLAQELGLRHGAVLKQVAEFGAAIGSSSHQMGTTRMGESAADSVVDRNCRIHSVPNLYVAGSSVFPTCGWANPTLSLVALSIRLADHLRSLP